MVENKKDIKYVPGMYAKRGKKKTNTNNSAGQWVRECEQKRLASSKLKETSARVNNCICFSRKIGVGALEIADLVAEKTGLRVVDREILEYIANDSNLRKKTVDFFDERHHGVIHY